MRSRSHGSRAARVLALAGRHAAVLGLAMGALAPSTDAATAVTVYSRDLGFVREDVTLERRQGDTVLVDVPERIDFSSVRFVPNQGEVRRLAYRFDLASGDRALERAVGTRIRAVLRSERVVEGTLLAVDPTWVTVREEDGSYHTVSRAALDDVQIAPPRTPLVTRPSLEVVLSGARAARAELSYLTGGLSWNAEHVVVRTGETRATWGARAVIDNTSGRDYDAATLKLVAGDVGRAGAPPMPVTRQETMVSAVAKDMSEQSFADYHLYTIARPATLRHAESQRLTMLDDRAVTIAPRYLYRGGDRVVSQIQVKNTRAAGLGEPLPGGRVRFYERDAAGALQFTGETTIRHTPVDEELTMEVGAAFDLVAERREVSGRRISDREREYTVAIELRNRKRANVAIVVEEHLAGDGEVTQSTHKYERKEANLIVFEVPVPAGQEVELRYTARVRW